MSRSGSKRRSLSRLKAEELQNDQAFAVDVKRHLTSDGPPASLSALRACEGKAKRAKAVAEGHKQFFAEMERYQWV